MEKRHTGVPDPIPQLLIHHGHAKTLLALILARPEIVRVRRADDAEAVPDEVAEFVVDVWAGGDVLVGRDEDVALGPLLWFRDGEVPDGSVG